MFINPRVAIDNGWITGIANPEVQVQPNAVDFTLDKLYTIDDRIGFVISEEKKKMRSVYEMSTSPSWDGDGMAKYWRLGSRCVYDGMSNVYVDLPEGVAAMLIIRSTFNRNGIFLTSGLYDSGFKGHLGFVLHNQTNGYALIAPGTRVGQVIFVSSDSASMYAGGWNHEEGTHYSEPAQIGPGSDNYGEG